MDSRTDKQERVWRLMQQLSSAGLGRAEAFSASRDKFILYPDHPTARPLTDRPSADGFIRSDKNGFLIRYASSEFRSNLPVELTAKAKRGSTKGLEYNWSVLQRRDIEALFARIAELASVPPADLA